MVRKTTGADVLDPPQDQDQDKPLADAGEADAATDKPKRVYQRKAPTQPIPVDAFDGEDVPEDQWDANPVHVSDKPRDAAQVKLDGEIGALKDAWVAAGSPAPVKSPRRRYPVSPDHAPAIRYLIGQAAALHGVKEKFSPPSFDKDGREIIVVTVMPIPVKKPRAVRVTETATESASADESGDGDSE